MFRTGDDEIFALIDRCPHRGGPLSEGIVQGRAVACPLHGWVIELDSGRAEAPDEGCTRTVAVRRDGERILLLLPPTCETERRRRAALGGGMSEAADIRTTCPYCGVGCGLTVASDGTIAGDKEHPANRGLLCSKGAALAETLDDAGRLLYPEIGGIRAGWDEALDLVAGIFSRTIDEHGPDAVALYVSGQFLTEDYYVANKLMKGFIGTANIDTNSRLCMASSVAGHVRAFGEDLVPGIYEDIDEADLVVLVGSNAAWCHPVLYRRLAAAKQARGTKIVVIDPRRTATCDIADLHLAIRPGSDVAVFAALLLHLVGSGACDRDFIGARTTGLAAAVEAARASVPSLAEAARIADVAAERSGAVLSIGSPAPSAPSRSIRRA